MNFDKIDLHLTEDESNLIGLVLICMKQTIDECDKTLRKNGTLTIGDSNAFEKSIRENLKRFTDIIETR